MFGIKKFLLGLKIVPKTASTADAKGELEVIDSTGKLGYHNGTSVSPVVTESHSAALTNKTIDADSNTITNIENADIKAAAAIDASKIADGSVSNTEFQYISTVTSNVQDQLNSKATATGLSDHINDTVDAHDASAISVSAISGLTATEVQAALAEHQVEIENTYNDLGAHITDTIDAHDASAISSIPSGNLAATEVQAALNELQTDVDTRATSSALGSHTGATSAHGVSGAIVGTSDSQVLTNKTITGADIRTPVRSDVKQDTKANLVTYALTASNGQLCFATDTKEMFQVVDTLLESVGGGAGIGGVDILFSQTFEEAALTDFTQTGLSLSTSSPLHGAISALMTHQPATSQSFKQVIAVDEKFRSLAMLLSLNIKSTATAGNVTISVYDETNAAAILASTQLQVSSATAGTKDSVSFTIPATCLSMSYTITALQEAGSPVTRIDDIICQLANSSLLETSVTVPNITAWQGYTPTFTGFGTPSSVQFEWRQNGENVDIRGKFTSGTSTAVEARATLPNSYTSADTTLIPSIQVIGKGAFSIVSPSDGVVLIEPSVNYLTFALQSASFSGLSKATGSGFTSLGTSFSFFASVPISGLSATSDVAIPLTQSGIVQEADSELRVYGANGYGSTNTAVLRFATLQTSTGDAIQYTDSATLGAFFTALKDGWYSVTAYRGDPVSTSRSQLAVVKNGTQGTSTGASVPQTETLFKAMQDGNSGAEISTGSWSGPLEAGDQIRVHGDALTSETTYTGFSMTYAGSLSQVSINTNSKITIPTSELRFEGASARGIVATAIVKFNTMAKIRGDAFTVTNTDNDGTFVTMTKAGKLSVSSSLIDTVAASVSMFISLNQAVLTTAPASPSEILSASAVGNNTGASISNNASWTGFVKVGDVIRVSRTSSPVANNANNLVLSFQEQDIQVSVSNTLPQFSESDSSVRVDTANGYGSTATKIRRFSNVRDNIGVDVEYVDSATNGASFTAKSDGIYSISYSENATSANNIVITKNSSDLTLNPVSLPASEILAISTTTNTTQYSETAAWTGYLVAGDIIRPQTSGVAATLNATVNFTMSKVGKPNVTGVDVTPFVNIPQPVSQSTISTTGNITVSTNLSAPVTPIRSTGSGIYSLSTAGVTVLKKCRMEVGLTGRGFPLQTAPKSIIRLNGTVVADTFFTVASGTHSATSSLAIDANVGDIITFEAGLTAASFSILATASSDQILTAPETFSTDTAPLVYAGSGTYTLATLANAPVGTFITYTYTSGTDTRIQTTTAPTQTTSAMNTDGIFLTPRAFNATGTAATPAIFLVQIGKGLLGYTPSAFAASGKTTPFNHNVFGSVAGSAEYGVVTNYDPSTGILTLDAGVNFSVSSTSRHAGIALVTGSSQTTGYMTVTASKNPALTGLGLGTVAARGVNTAGTNVITTTIPFDAVKTYDTHNALNTTTGTFTAPETGYYEAAWSVTFASIAYAQGDSWRSYITKNGSAYAYGSWNRCEAYQTVAHSNSSVGASGIYLAKGDTVSLVGVNTNSGGVALLTTSGTNYFSIHKTSVGTGN